MKKWGPVVFWGLGITFGRCAMAPAASHKDDNEYRDKGRTGAPR
jgi:hypothetical protein